MAMGRREREVQGDLWIETPSLPPAPAHPFYQHINEILDSRGFDGFVEEQCRRFYAQRLGRPSLPPAVYFRLLWIGYFEGIDSERGIAWRVADPLGLRRFLGYSLTDFTPDHSTISRNRRLIDPDARITRMKDGRTHLAHKAEHAVDLDTDAILAVTLQPADRGDTSSIEQTLEAAGENIVDVVASESGDAIHERALREIVADKGYHSNEVLKEHQGPGGRTYIAEPDRGRRDWEGQAAERDAVYANRRRIRGRRGRRWVRKRGELIERSFAHCYDTGGMRRTHLRKHENILKRLLIHVAGFNLSLVLRKLLGLGTARGLQGLAARVLGVWEGFWTGIRRRIGPRAFRIAERRNGRTISSAPHEGYESSRDGVLPRAVKPSPSTAYGPTGPLCGQPHTVSGSTAAASPQSTMRQSFP